MALSTSYQVRSPQWLLTYSGQNITADISHMIRDIKYIDELGGAAQQIEVSLEDHQRQWQGPWYPQQGDAVNLLIGYTGEYLLPCGDFQVDELALEGPPDVFYLRCLSAYITQMMRTRYSAAYEGQTIPQISTTIAAKYGLRVSAAAEELNVVYARVTQKHETDLEFLQRLATEHNYEFTVRGTQLVFYSRSTIEGSAPVRTLARSDVMAFGLLDKTHNTYASARVSYQQAWTKQLLTHEAHGDDALAPKDVLKFMARCEDGQQGRLRAESALHAANMTRTTFWAELPGSADLCSGNTIDISGFGRGDGTYLITAATHKLGRARGYTTRVDARRVA